jgi:hypothetical protein
VRLIYGGALVENNRKREFSSKPQDGLPESDDYSDYDQTLDGVTTAGSNQRTTISLKSPTTPLVQPSEDDETDNEDEESSYSASKTTKKRVKSSGKPTTISQGDDEALTDEISRVDGQDDFTLKFVTTVFEVQEPTPRTVHFVSSGSSSFSSGASQSSSSGRDVSNFSNGRNPMSEFSNGARGNTST